MHELTSRADRELVASWLLHTELHCAACAGAHVLAALPRRVAGSDHGRGTGADAAGCALRLGQRRPPGRRRRARWADRSVHGGAKDAWHAGLDPATIVEEMRESAGLQHMYGVFGSMLMRATISFWDGKRDMVRFA